MRTYLAGNAVALPVTFSQGGQPQVPDDESATYTLLDNAGATVEGHVAAQIDPNVHRAVITLPGEVNEISTQFEKRTVLINYEVDEVPYSLRIAYRLVPFLNYVVTPSQVRSYLGVNIGELPDDDIDLVRAYLLVQDTVGEEVLEEALAAGDIRETRANDALLYQAALDLIPSLRLRVAQAQVDGGISFNRPLIKDFDTLEKATRALLTDAIDVFSERAQLSFPLLITTTDADPITG